MVQEECNQNIPSPAVTGAWHEEPKSVRVGDAWLELCPSWAGDGRSWTGKALQEHIFHRNNPELRGFSAGLPAARGYNPLKAFSSWEQ